MCLAGGLPKNALNAKIQSGPTRLYIENKGDTLALSFFATCLWKTLETDSG
jgi:hypothetical protein